MKARHGSKQEVRWTIDTKKFNRQTMWSRIGFVALALAVAAVAAACGGDPDPEAQTRPDTDVQVSTDAEVQTPPAGEVQASPDAHVQVQAYIDTVSPMFEVAKADARAVDGSFSRPDDDGSGENPTPWINGMIEWQETLLGALSGVDDDLPVELKQAHDDYVAVMSELLELNRRVRDRLAEGGSDFSSPDLALDPELGLHPQDMVWQRESKACGNLEYVARKTVLGTDLECNYRKPGG